MKIAVTGASGNLGQRVVRIAIAQGHRVVGMDKVPPIAPPQVPEDTTSKDEWFRFVHLDIREYDQVLAAFRGCDAVIHLAAIPNPGDYVVETHNLNVVSSWNALRAAAELGIDRICQASSINAVGMVWGDNPIIDYLPMDEKHPCRPEDPYSLSKLICEMQADTIVRRWPNIRIASIRLSWAVPNREYAMGREMDWVRKELWSWVDAEESARAFVLGVTSGDFKGHETFFTIAPITCQDELTPDLIAEQWPNVELRREFHGHESLYDCSKAERLLGWVHAPVVPEGASAAPQPAEATEPEAAPGTDVPEPPPAVPAAETDPELVEQVAQVPEELDASLELAVTTPVEEDEVVSADTVANSAPAAPEPVAAPAEVSQSTEVSADPVPTQQPEESTCSSSSSSSDSTDVDGFLDADETPESEGSTDPSEPENEPEPEEKPTAVPLPAPAAPFPTLSAHTPDVAPPELHTSPVVEPVAP
ncbi:NAD(P)-binding protein [Auricularia subglabra TFB-10046 SS5]|nr:NAD(P)-binding protein [Auricularia subglabra TFB-10046 SS5]